MPTLRLVPTSGAPLEVTKDSSMVGRDPSCDFAVSDGSISRRHARIEKRGDSWAIVDQGSANGTFVDSQRVTDVVLQNGQELRLGAVAFKVEITPAPGDAVIDPGATVVQAIPNLAPPPAAPAPAPPPPPPAPAPKPPAPPAPKVAAPPAPPSAPPAPAAPKPAATAPTPKAPAPPPPVPPRPSPARPAAAPAARPAAPSAGKKRGPGFWIGTGCCGCLLLLLLGGGGLFGALYVMTKGPVEAVRNQLVELKSGQTDAAYARLTQAYQQSLSRADFERLVASHPAFRDNADSTFMSRNVTNGVARLEGSLTATSGEKEPVTYTLIQEAGAWKISAIQFAGDDITIPNTGAPR